VKVAKAQIRSLEDALDQYRLDVGRYPATEQGLAALNTQPAGEARWQGPYLKKAVPNDPWGNPYQYRSPGEHGELDISSLGKDGQPGGAGEAADLANW
jgi:general secretion pathway protein G